jgi:arabinose-5-phosphate isomerase
MTKNSFKESALRTISLEQDAVAELKNRINDQFSDACSLMLDCSGRIIVMGMGKSGHIANKIAATLASTGTPAHFVHPAEASHGDIGMITENDVVLALSNSGTTEELVSILPVLKRKGVPLIAMTGDASSILAQSANVNLDASVEVEACPLGLAPTTSTTASLVMGDALAMALLEARGFTAEDFAFSHPGGNLGRRLLLKVENVMHAGKDIPIVSEGTAVSQSLLEISAKKLGMTTIKNTAGELVGVFTDGDLRRLLDQKKDLQQTPIGDVMTTSFRSINASALASEAAKLMQDNEIYSLVVLDEERNLEGIITMHDLLKANVV